MNHKRIILCIILSLLLTACGKESNNSLGNTNADGSETIIINADYPYYESINKLIAASDYIFYGTPVSSKEVVLNISCQGDKSTDTGLTESTPVPYTIYKINLNQLFKGEKESMLLEDNCVNIKVLGHKNTQTDGKKIELIESQKYLFILNNTGDIYLSPINDTQSIYAVSSDSASIKEILDAIK